MRARVGWDALPAKSGDKTSDASAKGPDMKLWSHAPAHATAQSSAGMPPDAKGQAPRAELEGGLLQGDVRHRAGAWKDAALSPPATLGDLMSAGETWGDGMLGAEGNTLSRKSGAAAVAGETAGDAVGAGSRVGAVAERVGRGDGAGAGGGAGGCGKGSGPRGDSATQPNGQDGIHVGEAEPAHGRAHGGGVEASAAATKRDRVVTWKDRRGAGKLQEERLVAELSSGADGGILSKANAPVSKWSTPSKHVRGAASSEWTQGVSGETAQMLQVLLGVQPSVPAGGLGGGAGKGTNGAGLEARDEMRKTWQAILAVEEEEGGAGGKRGGGGSEVLTSDDEGEPVHSAACLLEEEDDASPSLPAYPQWQIGLLSPAVKEVGCSRGGIVRCRQTQRRRCVRPRPC